MIILDGLQLLEIVGSEGLGLRSPKSRVVDLANQSRQTLASPIFKSCLVPSVFGFVF